MSVFGAAVGMKAIDSAFQFAGEAGLSAINNAFWKQNYRTQLEGQKELFDYQSAYNSPSAQMARLQAAGLNPNLIYGSQAPAGTSGNMPSVPSGYGPSGSFNTQDVAANILQLAEARSQSSVAERNFAEANFLNKQAGRYDELVDLKIRMDNQEINHINSQMHLEASQAALHDAHQLLAVAQKSYTEGQSSLLEYERKKLTAQTLLFQAQRSKENYLADTAKAESEIMKLEATYQSLFYTEGHMKELSQAEYDALKDQFDKEAKVAAARAGIEGSKVAQWIDYVFTQLGKLAGSANQSTTAYRNAKGGLKKAK